VNLETREIQPVELPELAELRDAVCRERRLTPEGTGW